eukprot:CAMPEP_0196664426 /NCGR_PEP_ID=MMETSP1086-20130531/57135_1 /TAXON_ID=77921 /ORGANISM="Cyanoptyche  gloeocystis , Strain SAG4.97" /LENGTH=117 /DNA_ID=CAMNT_0042000729 /DNA_START=37 /DNA_END=386 /DNA_ORIENTATION=+
MSTDAANMLLTEGRLQKKKSITNTRELQHKFQLLEETIQSYKQHRTPTRRDGDINSDGFEDKTDPCSPRCLTPSFNELSSHNIALALKDDNSCSSNPSSSGDSESGERLPEPVAVLR